ncbi:MAG: N-acetylglucosamine-6-phosphate deacetylase [Chthoniobacterales bacterium]
MKIIARDFQSGIPHEYSVENERFEEIQAIDTDDAGKLPWIAPGLFDVQVNGFGGVDFNNPITRDDWQQANAQLAGHGCTHFLATLITNARGNYRELLEGLKNLRSEDSGLCRGYHMEGPFLNPDSGTRGAHNSEWMTAADLSLLSEWQEISGNEIRLITLAPEIEPGRSLPFIQKAVADGIGISLGHSLARGEILKQAIATGAGCWTHLGNAIGKFTDKFDNVLFHVLGADNIRASLIPDGIHIPPPAFHAMANSLGDRLILTTDAMSAAGAPPGKYRLCQHEIVVGEDLVARTHEGRLAGSTLTPFDAVFNAAAMSEKPWPLFWEALSTGPAKWLGVDHRLAAGLEASFCLLAPAPLPKLQATYLKGRRIFGDA